RPSPARSVRPETATSQPAAASARAVALPMPRVAPVTIARFSTRPSVILWYLSECTTWPNVFPEDFLEHVRLVRGDEGDDQPAHLQEESHALLGPSGIEVGPVTEIPGAPDAT